MSDEQDSVRVPSVVPADVLAYYDGDETIQMYDQYLSQRVFNRIPSVLSDPSLLHAEPDATNHTVPSWYVEWNFGGLLSYRTLFNSPTFLHQLSVFLVRARIHVRVFGYVAFWYQRDISGWVRNTMQGEAGSNGGLPFGILEPYEYELRFRSKFVNDLSHARVHLTKEHGVGTGLYIHDLQLMPVPVELIDGARQRMQDRFGRNKSVQSIQQSSDDDSQYVPRSVFYALHKERLLLDEAVVNQYDADWAVSHPRVLLNSQPPSTLAMSVTNASDRDRYTTDTIMEAAQAQAMRLQTYTYSEVVDSLSNTLRHHGLLNNGRRDETTPRELRRQYFRRPDPVQDAYVFPEIARVAASPAANVIIDVDAQQRVYDEHVRQHMGLHVTRLRTPAQAQRERQVAANMANGMVLADDIGVDDLIAHERDIMSNIFEAVWRAAFNTYDMKLVSDTIDGFTDREQAVKDEEDEALRTTVKSLRKFLRRAQRHPRATASLVFEVNHERKNRDRLNVMMALYPQGLIEPRELERTMRAVYGQHVSLREPPPEFLGAVVEPPPPKKRKKDDDDDDDDDEPDKKKSKKK